MERTSTSIHYTNGVRILKHLRDPDGSVLECGGQRGWIKGAANGVIIVNERGEGKLWQKARKVGRRTNKGKNISGDEVQA